MTLEARMWAGTLKEVDREFRRLVAALNIIVEVDRRIFETSSALDDLLEEMLKGTCKLTKARFAQILLRHGHELVVAHSTDPSHRGTTFAIDDCVCGIAVEQGKSVISGDVQKDFGERYKALLGHGRTKMRSEVVVPIKSPPPHSVIVGVLNVEWPQVDAFDPRDTEIVEQFARQAGAAIHSARFREALQLTLDLAKHVRAVSPHDAVRSTLSKLARFFPHKVEVQFLVHERQAGTLAIECSTIRDTERVRVLVDNSFCGHVVRERRPLLSNDVQVEYASYFQDTVGGTRSELAVPIFDSDENVVGVLNVESAVRHAFTEHDLYLLSVLAESGVWQRLREMRRTRAIASMAAVGDVAANAVHFFGNLVAPIEFRCSKLISLAPPGEASADFNRELHTLRVLLLDVTNSMRMLDEKYKNALRGNVETDLLQMVATTRSMITRPDVSFVADVDPAITLLQLPATMPDVLWNLVSNANLAIPEDRPGEIVVRTRIVKGTYTHKPEVLTIEVIDNGKGLKSEEVDDIFELGNGDRHGFGLWWLRTFVERCDGTVTVQSEPDKGARFRLSFPLTADGSARVAHDL